MKLIFTIFIHLLITTALSKEWMNVSLSPSERAKAILSKMTIDEKFDMIHGMGGAYAGDTPYNARLGIPALHMEDGPQVFF
jgi:beta-glucosidase